jgi:hypothetical protein
MNNTKVSICIAAYEMGGKGQQYLHHSFIAINEQTHDNIEVVVSDQSTDDNIKNLCKEWSDKLNINYIWFDGERKSSSNTNNAMKNATGDIIKILFMDDILFVKDAIKFVVEAFEKEPDKTWLVSVCGHIYESKKEIGDFMIPNYHDEIHKGRNTISSPSVMSIKNIPDLIYFDEKLIWLMDVEYYKRLYDKFGLPIIIESATVLNRIHDNSVSSEMDSEEGQKVKDEELKYVIEKIEGVVT